MAALALTLPSEAAAEPAGFDYGSMNAATAKEAKAVAARYRARQEAYVMDTGRDLVAVKARLEHGLFQRWVEQALGLTPRTAQNLMQAASVLGHKSEIVSHLPPGVLYQLTAKSTPAPVRDKVVSRLEAGEALPVETIADEIKAAREARAKRAAAEREAARRAKLSDEQRESEDLLRRRDAKSKAARERKAEEEAETRDRERRRVQAECKFAAEHIVAGLGAHYVSALSARLGRDLDTAFRRAADLANVVRARSEPTTEVHPNDVFRTGFNYGRAAGQDRVQMEALAEEIRRDGLKEPLTVIKREGDSRWYELLEGHYRFGALVDVLGWQTVPVRIVRPVDQAEVEKIAPPPTSEAA